MNQIVQRWLERRRLKQQINEEIAFHIEQAVEEELERGLSPSDARREARRRFGSARSVRGLCLEFARHGELKPDRPQAPFAVLAVVAASTPVVLAALLLPQHVYQQPIQAIDTLAVSTRSVPWVRMDGRRFDELGQELGVFQGSAGFQPISLQGVFGSNAEHWLTGLSVTPNFLDLLETPLLHGAGFQPRGGDQVVVSHELWRSRLGADPKVIGRSLALGGASYKIVGVAPAAFWALRPTENFWLTNSSRTERAWYVARLSSHLTPESADTALAAGGLVATGRPVSLSQIRQRAPRAALWIVSSNWALLLILGLVQTVSLRQTLVGVRARWRAAALSYLFLSVKALPVLASLAVCWTALVESSGVAFSPVFAFCASFLFLLASIAVVWWSLVDQTLRCVHCLRTLRMPLDRGTVGSILFDLPGSEYICSHGHGTLYLPAPTSARLQEPTWTPPSGLWHELVFSNKKA